MNNKEKEIYRETVEKVAAATGFAIVCIEDSIETLAERFRVAKEDNNKKGETMAINYYGQAEQDMIVTMTGKKGQYPIQEAMLKRIKEEGHAGDMTRYIMECIAFYEKRKKTYGKGRQSDGCGLVTKPHPS